MAPPSTLTAPQGGFGTYEFRSADGVSGSMEIPTEATNPDLAEYEPYRQLAKAPEVTYILVAVDNQSSDTSVNMYQVVVVTQDGDQVIFEDAGNRVGEWMSSFGYETDEEVRKYNIGVDLANKSVENLRPRAKGKRVMAVEGDLPSVKRVFVYPSGGFEEVEAVRVG